MFEDRIKKLRIILSEEKLDAMLVSSAVNIGYLTGYFNFSKDEREAYVFVSKQAVILFTDPRYIEAVEKIVSKKIKATINPWTKVLQKEIEKKKITTLGFEKNLTFEEHRIFKKHLGIKLISTDDFVEELRSEKDKVEIATMRKAATLTDKTFNFIKKKIKVGVSEKEIALEMELFIMKNGGTLAFDSIVAFGTNSSIPHHMTSDKKLSEKDSFVLLDFGAKVDGYCCDMTRTLIVNPTDKAKKIYQAVLDAQLAAINYIDSNENPEGKKAAEISNEILTKNNFPPVPHGLGHGIGLEVHETPHLSPKTDDVLFPNQVFSVEPGIYISGFGGVRIEDTAFFNGAKLEPLTTSTKELEVL
jgi:Xaa-Pro aminopeptidase